MHQTISLIINNSAGNESLVVKSFTNEKVIAYVSNKLLGISAHESASNTLP